MYVLLHSRFRDAMSGRKEGQALQKSKNRKICSISDDGEVMSYDRTRSYVIESSHQLALASRTGKMKINVMVKNIAHFRYPSRKSTNP